MANNNPIQELVAKSLRSDLLEKIVLDFAERSPIYPGEITGDPFCAMCEADLIIGDPEIPSRHEPECPWRRAQEYKEEKERYGS